MQLVPHVPQQLEALLPIWRAEAATYPTSEQKIACSWMRALAAHMQDRAVMRSGQPGADLHFDPGQWQLVSGRCAADLVCAEVVLTVAADLAGSHAAIVRISQ
jgi:hypothetical protein